MVSWVATQWGWWGMRHTWTASCTVRLWSKDSVAASRSVWPGILLPMVARMCLLAAYMTQSPTQVPTSCRSTLEPHISLSWTPPCWRWPRPGSSPGLKVTGRSRGSVQPWRALASPSRISLCLKSWYWGHWTLRSSGCRGGMASGTSRIWKLGKLGPMYHLALTWGHCQHWSASLIKALPTQQPSTICSTPAELCWCGHCGTPITGPGMIWSLPWRGVLEEGGGQSWSWHWWWTWTTVHLGQAAGSLKRKQSCRISWPPRVSTALPGTTSRHWSARKKGFQNPVTWKRQRQCSTSWQAWTASTRRGHWWSSCGGSPFLRAWPSMKGSCTPPSSFSCMPWTKVTMLVQKQRWRSPCLNKGTTERSLQSWKNERAHGHLLLPWSMANPFAWRTASCPVGRQHGRTSRKGQGKFAHHCRWGSWTYPVPRAGTGAVNFWICWSHPWRMPGVWSTFGQSSRAMTKPWSGILTCLPSS